MGALLAALASSTVVIISAGLLLRRIGEVHKVVNSRLDNALLKISSLEEEIRHLRLLLQQRPAR